MIDMVAGRKSEKREIAEQLCVLYHEAVRNAVSVLSATVGGGMPSRKLDDLDKTARRAFMQTAQACIDLKAEPREFIVAQFAMWRSASAYHKKLLLPQPPNLASLAARVRYLQHKANAEIRISRKPQPEEGDGKNRFFTEERHLRGLARMQRRDPVEVLTEQPEQFSSDFLRHKGVWDVVQDLWEDRQRSS
jgi:hypothetical protein